MAITKQTNADLDDVALTEDGDLLVGTGIPNGGFYTATDGELTLAVGIRYQNNNTPVETGPVVETAPTDEDGNPWVFIVAAYTADVELPLTNLYEIKLITLTEMGQSVGSTPQNLSYDGFNYILYPLPRDTAEPNTGKVNVIEEVVYTGPKTGRYRIGLQATNKQTGVTFDAITELSVPAPNVGVVIQDPILGIGLVIG